MPCSIAATEGTKGMETAVFYLEWLALDKSLFRILAMLADVGQFRGNLSDLCRYFSLDPQTKTRATLRNAIEELAATGFITCERSGNTYTLGVIPKANEIEIHREWLQRLKKHEYSSESVAWEMVLKVHLWIMLHSNDSLVKNDMIAADLNTSVSTIGSAKNVLQREYEAITRSYVSKKIGENRFIREGQRLAASAWWKE